jgi:UDP-galactopyranose mutase
VSAIIADYVVVGTGLTGATIARILADHGREVVLLERRPHIGGNVHDSLHSSGIRYHSYGPHYFRTSSDEIWAFVNRFASFYRYEAIVKTMIDGRCESWPLSRQSIERRLGKAWAPTFSGVATNFEEACLTKMPRLAYELFVKGYTEKQWGVPARTLSPDLAARVSVLEQEDPRLFPKHRYQALPTEGYGAMMTNLTAGLPVHCELDYLRNRTRVRARRLLIYTGPIDAFFDYAHGPLCYRGQRRRHQFLPGLTAVLPSAQVNLPDPAQPAVRIIEWKWLMPPGQAESLPGTLITYETPFSPRDPDQYEYPFPDDRNRARYEQYRRRASAVENLLICGRLGEYRYLDMDQAIGRALTLARRICGIARESSRTYSLVGRPA